MEANQLIVYFVSFVLALSVLVLAAMFCAGALNEQEEALTCEGWHSPATKPQHLGKYRIRPVDPDTGRVMLKAAQTVRWDGAKFRHSDGLECYWQHVEWHEVVDEPAMYFNVDRTNVDQLREALQKESEMARKEVA